MPHITKVLGQEAGLQYQGVKDKTGGTGQAPVNSLIVGKFKRGRLDQTMTVTAANLNAVLGYDPTNPDYVTVADYLATGVPSVEVFRLLSNETGLCTPTKLTIEPKLMEYPNNNLAFKYNLDITENGVTRSVEDYVQMTYDQLMNYESHMHVYSILRQLMIDLNFYIMDDSFAFDLQPVPTETLNGTTLFSGVEGLKEKRSITLKFKPLTGQIPELNFDLLLLINTINGQPLSSDNFVIHSCGFNLMHT